MAIRSLPNCRLLVISKQKPATLYVRIKNTPSKFGRHFQGSSAIGFGWQPPIALDCRNLLGFTLSDRRLKTPEP